MKAALQAKLGQQIGMTPQLLQSIRLLQLDGLALELEVQRALDTNPLLELDGADEDDTTPALPVPDADLARVVIDQDEPESAYERGFDAPTGGEHDEDAMLRVAAIDTGDFRSLLRGQFALGHVDAVDNALAALILDHTGDAGYLETSLDALRTAATDAGLDATRLEGVRQTLLHLDPAGICAVDLAECLTAQLAAFGNSDDVVLARRIVAAHLGLLAARDIPGLAVALRVDRAAVEAAVRLIRSLDPRPADTLRPAAEAVVPDVLVDRREGGWHVALNPRCTPRLRVHAAYEDTLARDRSAASEPMREMLDQARWLTRGLNVRHDTLARTAAAIVARQHGFLERGEEAMAPLTLREIADDIGVHESTISRITTGKYMLTPRGTFELKHFFAVRLAGATVAGAAVKARIARLIGTENPVAPLSDEDLTVLLARQGIHIARRTVAKYREQLEIPTARARVRGGMRATG